MNVSNEVICGLWTPKMFTVNKSRNLFCAFKYIFLEGVRTFYQTLTGVHDKEKFKNPCTRSAFHFKNLHPIPSPTCSQV